MFCSIQCSQEILNGIHNRYFTNTRYQGYIDKLYECFYFIRLYKSINSFIFLLIITGRQPT